ncbi:ATP-binding protein [Actinacidiphila alni]|nr:ATP-binding protein [Actinacidiphila alni]
MTNDMLDAPPPAAADAAAPVKLWPPTAWTVHRARHALVDVLDEWELDELGDVAQLVLSELLTNAVRHGRVPGRDIGTRFLRLAEGGLRIEVHDPREAGPAPRTAGAWDEDGRGLALVEALTAGRWGTATREGPGKLVWADLLPEGARLP